MARIVQDANRHRKSAINAMLSPIPPEWKDFLRERNLFDNLRSVLELVYDKHALNQTWQGVPRVRDIFNWMTCPPRNVSAIVLLMEPMSCDPRAEYRSTGYAFGIERCEGVENANISKVPTLWKLFEILHKFRDRGSWTENAQEHMRQLYNAGFDPQRLSERGILFLNVALTKGWKGRLGANGREDNDLDIWWPFLADLLREIEKAAGVEQIAVIQLYNKGVIQDFLTNNEGKYSTYRPDFMRLGGNRVVNGSWHITRFKETHINGFLAGLGQHEKHRRIIQEIANEVIDGSQCSFNI